jgi:hypothetical protein
VELQGFEAVIFFHHHVLRLNVLPSSETPPGLNNGGFTICRGIVTYGILNKNKEKR